MSRGSASRVRAGLPCIKFRASLFNKPPFRSTRDLRRTSERDARAHAHSTQAHPHTEGYTAPPRPAPLCTRQPRAAPRTHDGSMARTPRTHTRQAHSCTHLLRTCSCGPSPTGCSRRTRPTRRLTPTPSHTTTPHIRTHGCKPRPRALYTPYTRALPSNTPCEPRRHTHRVPHDTPT